MILMASHFYPWQTELSPSLRPGRFFICFLSVTCITNYKVQSIYHLVEKLAGNTNVSALLLSKTDLNESLSK